MLEDASARVYLVAWKAAYACAACQIVGETFFPDLQTLIVAEIVTMGAADASESVVAKAVGVFIAELFDWEERSGEIGEINCGRVVLLS